MASCGRPERHPRGQPGADESACRPGHFIRRTGPVVAQVRVILDVSQMSVSRRCHTLRRRPMTNPRRIAHGRGTSWEITYRVESRTVRQPAYVGTSSPRGPSCLRLRASTSTFSAVSRRSRSNASRRSAARHIARQDGALFLNSHGGLWRRGALNDSVWEPTLLRAGQPTSFGCIRCAAPTPVA